MAIESKNAVYRVINEEIQGVMPLDPSTESHLVPTIDVTGTTGELTEINSEMKIGSRRNAKGATGALNVSPEINTEAHYNALDLFAQDVLFTKFQGFMTRSVLQCPIVAETGDEKSVTNIAFKDLIPNCILKLDYYGHAENNKEVLVKTVDAVTGKVIFEDTAVIAEATPPKNATIRMAGYQIDAETTIIVNKDETGSLTINSPIDFSKGLFVGQSFFIGGKATEDKFVNHNLNDLCRVLSIVTDATSTTIGFDKFSKGVMLTGTETETTTTQKIKLYFEKYAADQETLSPLFKNWYKTMHSKFIDDETNLYYENYVNGARVNSMEIGYTPNQLNSLKFSMMGSNVVSTREYIPSTINEIPSRFTETISPNEFGMQLLYLRANALGSKKIQFLTLTATVGNNIENVFGIGHTPPIRQSAGMLDVNVGGSVVYGGDSSILESISKENCDVTISWLMVSNDGAVFFDLPNCQITANPQPPEMNISIKAYGSNKEGLKHCLGMSFFSVTTSEKTSTC